MTLYFLESSIRHRSPTAPASSMSWISWQSHEYLWGQWEISSAMLGQCYVKSLEPMCHCWYRLSQRPFDPWDAYDIAFFGGGKTTNSIFIVSAWGSTKEDSTPWRWCSVLAICGGFQLLGQYYIFSFWQTHWGILALWATQLNQVNNRHIGDIKIHNEEFNLNLLWFENHQGRTFLAEDENC